MTTEQLSLWGDAPPIDEPAEPLTWCPGTIERDGQTLYYVDGLLEGTPRYEPRPDLDAIAGVPYDLLQRGWRRHPYKSTWLLLEEPGKPGLVCSGDQTFAGAIEAARKCEAVWADMDAAKAAYEAQKAEQVGKRKKIAA